MQPQSDTSKQKQTKHRSTRNVSKDLKRRLKAAIMKSSKVDPNECKSNHDKIRRLIHRESASDSGSIIQANATNTQQMYRIKRMRFR